MLKKKKNSTKVDLGRNSEMAPVRMREAGSALWKSAFTESSTFVLHVALAS